LAAIYAFVWEEYFKLEYVEKSDSTFCAHDQLTCSPRVSHPSHSCERRVCYHWVSHATISHKLVDWSFSHIYLASQITMFLFTELKQNQHTYVHLF